MPSACRRGEVRRRVLLKTRQSMIGRVPDTALRRPPHEPPRNNGARCSLERQSQPGIRTRSRWPELRVATLLAPAWHHPLARHEPLGGFGDGGLSLAHFIARNDVTAWRNAVLLERNDVTAWRSLGPRFCNDVTSPSGLRTTKARSLFLQQRCGPDAGSAQQHDCRASADGPFQILQTANRRFPTLRAP